MGYAEGVTHTSWDRNAPNLSDWPAAKIPLYALLKAFEQYFEKNSAPERPEAHEDLSALEEGFMFDGTDEGRIERKLQGGTAVVTGGSLRRDGQHYEFSFKIKIDQDTAKSFVDLEVCAGLESGGVGAADRFEISKLDVPRLISQEKLDKARERRIRLHLPKVDSEHVFKISGRTADLDDEVLRFTQAMLRVVPRPAGKPERSGSVSVVIPGQED